MKRTRCNHGAEFKAQVTFAAFKDDKTLAELATQFVVHHTEIPEWKPHVLAMIRPSNYGSAIAH